MKNYDALKLTNMNLSELLKRIREKEPDNKSVLFLTDVIEKRIDTGDIYLSERLGVIREKESDNKVAMFLTRLIDEIISIEDQGYCLVRDSLIQRLSE